MKKVAIVALFIFASSTFITHAMIMIKNEYKKPVIIDLDGVEQESLSQNGTPLLLTTFPKKIKIRAADSPIYHKGIQKELLNIYTSTQLNPSFNAIITILDTNNPFFFDYDTRIFYPPARTIPPANNADADDVLADQPFTERYFDDNFDEYNDYALKLKNLNENIYEENQIEGNDEDDLPYIKFSDQYKNIP